MIPKQHIDTCIIIPTYNNDKTLKQVLDDVLMIIQANPVIVVNDGATDSTAEILKTYQSQISILTNETNQGKGYSLRKAFRFAQEQGFTHALTIDSDGQHFASDIPKLLEASSIDTNAVIMGSRNMHQEGVPNKSSFGNKFSNFWFKIETWISLPDTQTGFRVYPLLPMKEMHFFTSKFEFEIESIVRLAWKNVDFIPVPIQVKYDESERVSHFRPFRDFFRISVLNSVLVLFALLYFYPKKLISIETWRAIKHEAIKPEESNLRKSISLGFGVFMGIFPIWGFQLLLGIPLAVFFRLNKVLFIVAANISIPPMIPVIIYLSFLVGQFSTSNAVDPTQLFDLSLDSIQLNLYQYFVGAILLAIISFIVISSISFLMLSIFRRKPQSLQ